MSNVKYKCPECETEMGLNEDVHTCPNCDTKVTIDEATKLFEDGKIVAIVESKEDEEITPTPEVVVEEINYKVDITEDVAALVENEELSEEFKNKAITIFESAINKKAKEIAETMEANNAIVLGEAIKKAETEMETRINDYLDYVVNEWMSENEVAIDAGLKNEITEQFIEGLGNLFKESYIEVPEGRYDIVEELDAKVKSLQESLDSEINKSIELSKEIKEQKASSILQSVSEDLADTNKEKLAELAETVEFTTEEEYTEKLSTLKESYLTSIDTKTEITEDGDSEEKEEKNDLISQALKVMKSGQTHF